MSLALLNDEVFPFRVGAAGGYRDRVQCVDWLRFLCTGRPRLQGIYAYLRRRGYPADQAQDLTQEFFTRVLEGRYLDRADPEKGRFRCFLLTSLKFFVADEGDRQRAHKRGGGMVVPLEFSSGEHRYQREPAHDETPERIFERRWALSVLD